LAQVFWMRPRCSMMPSGKGSPEHSPRDGVPDPAASSGPEEHLMNEEQPQRPNHAPLIWIDLEMSGLDPDKRVILEVACIVPDGELGEQGEGVDLVVHQSDEVLDAMDEWCTRHHGQSGLTAAVKASTISLREAELRTLDYLRRHTNKGQSPLCGS